jgi:DNA-binding MurR/RpiR family transcriptional regulator
MTDYDPHDQLLAASTLRKDDVAVLISYTGETQDTIATMNVVKAMGATSISLTKYGPNQLNEMANIKLYADYTETLLRSSAMCSRIAMLTVIDVLFTAVASRSYNEIKPSLDKTKQIIDQKRMKLH